MSDAETRRQTLHHRAAESYLCRRLSDVDKRKAAFALLPLGGRGALCDDAQSMTQPVLTTDYGLGLVECSSTTVRLQSEVVEKVRWQGHKKTSSKQHPEEPAVVSVRVHA